MRIAMLVPIPELLPAGYHRPLMTVISSLVNGLKELGVDIVVYRDDRSATADPKVADQLLISTVFERADEVDLIHNHFGYRPLSFALLTTTPMVTVIHGLLSPYVVPLYKKYDEVIDYISTNTADRSKELTYTATILPGIDPETFTFRSEHGEYLLFTNGIHPNSGAKEAIEIADRTGYPLVLAGPIMDHDFDNHYIKPYIDEKRVKYLGTVTDEQRNGLLGGALAYLAFTTFEDHFGLTALEALACGTPVIAFMTGIMPELIYDGITGFIVASLDEAVTAVHRVQRLDRQTCRNWIMERYHVDRMVRKYLTAYTRILAGRKREDHRPWGYYRILADEQDHKVKRIVVFPGKRLSYQWHHYRDEHWQIVHGEAIVTLNDEDIQLTSGQAIDIPRGAKHRLRNPGTENTVFIEIQRGDYFGEDDIERIEDDYGRV